jgi:hypothetical protein
VPGAIAGPPCHWETQIQGPGPGPPVWGLDGKLTTTLFCEKIIVAKYKEAKTGSDLAESSKEGYGSKSAVLTTTTMMVMIMMMNTESVPQYVSSPNYRTKSDDN